MPQLHETMMGRKLIEHTLPEMVRQLERVANGLEKNNEVIIRLQERYKTLSELDPDPKSKHKMHIKILKEMDKTLQHLKLNGYGC